MATIAEIQKRSKVKQITEQFSHKITIYQKHSFISEAQGKGAPEFMALAKQSIGAYFVQSTSKVAGSGLTFDDQKLLMPLIVDCEPNDRNFRDRCAEYFAGIRTTIPYEKGKTLEIGLEHSKDPFDLAPDNLPINIAEYLIYRHALTHPWVAESKKAAEDNMITQFYIFDPEAEETATLGAGVVKDVAIGYYLKLKTEPQLVNMLLTMFKEDPRKYKGVNATAAKLARAKTLAETKPERFIEIYEDNRLEQQYLIESMILTKILNRAGNTIINPETSDVIGHDMVEAVAYVKDPLNSQTMVLLLARLQEALGESALIEMTKK